MKRMALQLALAAALAALLLAVLSLYQQPDFLVRMADQLWSCF